MVITRSLTNRASADTATSIELGNCVTEIGRGAFSGYTNISDAELPVNLNRIGVGAFSGSSVITVDIPDNVQTIGSSAFSNCNSLSSCTIGSGVTDIDSSAFQNCSGLTNTTLPNSLRTIGASAFAGCRLFTNITIPSGITSIGTDAFSDCSGLIRINMSATTPPIIGSCFDSTNEYPIYVPSSSYDDYMSASTWSNYYSRIVYEGIPYKALFITNSGLNRFIKCDSGTSVSALTSMPSGITTTRFGTCIDKIVSFDSTSLGNVVIPSNVKRIGNGAFASAYTESITFSEGLETIGNQAFYYFNNYYNSKYYNYPEIDITLPSTLNTVGVRAFTNAKISSITINGSSTLEFDGDVFKQYNGSTTTPLKRLTVRNIKSIQGFGELSALTSVSISNIESIGDSTFDSCASLTNLSITSNSPMTIGNSAFVSCRGLTNVVLPNSVTSIGTSAFGYCSGLTSINIPTNVTTIADNTFKSCISLSSITVPNTVTSIGASAFTQCKGLISVTLPINLTSLSYGLFYGCSKLTTVTIPNTVISIGKYTFQNSGIKNISIPSSVITIGEGAFQNCEKLVSITMQKVTPPTIGANTFGGTTTCPIYVPTGSYDLYVNAENWSAYADRIIEIGSTIKAYVAEQNNSGFTIQCGESSALTKNDFRRDKESVFIYGLIVGSCTTSIGYELCSMASNLGYLIMSNSVTYIGASAFYECRSLTNVTMSNSVTSIGDSAFYNCRFKSIDLPNGLTGIGSEAFRYTSLTSVTIPSSVTVIGARAFYSCGSLTSITVNATTPPRLYNEAFYYTNNCPIYVPAQSVQTYKSAESWSDYASRIQPIPNS